MVVSILVFIARCMILDKSNEQWWKMFIPFYNEYTMFKIAGKSKLWWIQLVCSLIILGCATYIMILLMGILGPAMFSIEEVAGDVVLENIIRTMQALISAPAFIIFMALASIASTVSFVINILFNIALAKSFGQGGAFAVGLILVQPIFLCILGFGNFNYVGNETATV